MKISLLQQDLVGPLQSVSRSVGVRSTLPVLDNILLATEGSKLKIAATNLEVGVIKQIPVEVIEPGEITVPAKTILEIIPSLKQAKLELETSSEQLQISSGKFQAKINGISASEFPVIPQSEGQGVIFPKEVLSGVATILFAAAVDEGRPVLTGILAQSDGETLDFVATDGFRLAHRQVKLPSKKVTQFRSLIPKKTLEEVVKILSEEEADEVTMTTSKDQNQAMFKTPQTLLSSRLIEGNFPSWEKIIPKEITTRVILDKEEIVKAVKLAVVFARTEGYVVFKMEKGKLQLESSAKELGSQENEVEGQVEGSDLTLAISGKFLTDALSAAPSTQVMMEFSGTLTPLLIKPVGVEGLEYVIMPVRIN